MVHHSLEHHQGQHKDSVKRKHGDGISLSQLDCSRHIHNGTAGIRMATGKFSRPIDQGHIKDTECYYRPRQDQVSLPKDQLHTARDSSDEQIAGPSTHILNNCERLSIVSMIGVRCAHK